MLYFMSVKSLIILEVIFGQESGVLGTVSFPHPLQDWEAQVSSEAGVSASIEPL